MVTITNKSLAPSFLNYRGAALVSSDFQTMQKLESALSSPIPHLYDEGELGVWPEEPTMIDDPWGDLRHVPWRGILRQYPWDSQLGLLDFAFTTMNGYVTGLSLYDAGLEVIPSAVFNFNHLARLLLKGNHITNVSPLIGQLKALTSLAIEGELTTLPSNLVSLKELVLLDIRDTRIDIIPRVLLELPKLAQVVIDTRFPENDPILIELHDKGVLIEMRFGSSYEPTREEIIRWILYYDRTHPGWDLEHFHRAVSPQFPPEIDPILFELGDEGLINNMKKK